jgi:hypothetical protein
MELLKNLATNLRADLQGKKLHLVIFSFLAILFLVLYVVANLQRGEEQQAPEYIPFDGPAILLNTDTLFSDINNTRQFEALRIDIKYFARALVDPYRDGSKEVVFDISTYQISDSEIRIEGEYVEEEGKVIITASRKNYGVLETSIESPFGLSSDIQLPSQSEKNKFIGGLPQKTNQFQIDYLERSDTFYITFSGSVTPEAIVAARAFLEENLNNKNLNRYNISAVGIGPNGNVISVDL